MLLRFRTASQANQSQMMGGGRLLQCVHFFVYACSDW